MNACKMISSLLVLGMATAVQAQEKDKLSWSGSLSMARAYDSAVSLEQIDQVSRESDYANQLKWSLAGKWQASESFNLGANYQGKRREYDQTSDYDLEQHHAALSAKYRYAGFGYSYRYDEARAKVDGERFLNFSQSMLALDKLVDSRFYLRGALAGNRKDFIRENDRDAEAYLLSLDALVFFNSASDQPGNNHLSLHLSAEKESANLARYDNQTQGLSLSYERSLLGLVFPASLISTIAYSHKRYEHFMVNQSGGLPLIGETGPNQTRVDNKLHGSVGLEYELRPWLELLIQADYIHTDSNYSLVDYDEKQMSLGLRVHF